LLPNALVISVALLGAVFAFPSQKNLEAQVEAGSPVKALEFIEHSHLSGPMLNDYAFGGFLIWAAPEYPVMIDGRTDLYEWAGVYDAYDRWIMLQSDPSSFPDQYKANFCLVGSGSSMDRILKLLGNWKRVYADKQAVVYVRTPQAAGQALE